jgi:hypothetical protein
MVYSKENIIKSPYYGKIFKDVKNVIFTPTEKKNETNLFIFIHSKTMLQVIC